MNLTIRDWVSIVAIVFTLATLLFGVGQAKEQLVNKADKSEIEVVKKQVENNEKKLDTIDKKVDKIYLLLIDKKD